MEIANGKWRKQLKDLKPWTKVRDKRGQRSRRKHKRETPFMWLFQCKIYIYILQDILHCIFKTTLETQVGFFQFTHKKINSICLPNLLIDGGLDIGIQVWLHLFAISCLSLCSHYILCWCCPSIIVTSILGTVASFYFK